MPLVFINNTILIAALTLLSIMVTMVTMVTLPLVIKCHLLALIPRDPVTPIVFRFPHAVAEVPTVISVLQRKTITQLFKDAGASLETHISQSW